ncbi:eCIS core domain-containing protein [Streptomyces acidicola]|uniref:eCIS core domain-containing protein n=1 Tax=Streptomyces acidicola TaxID=2596892 RepID=UPI0034327333
MRAQESRSQQTGARRQDRTAVTQSTSAQRMLAIQRRAGNSALTRAIEEERHEQLLEGQQSGPKERDAEGAVPVQRRSTVPDAIRSPASTLEPRILQRAEQAYDMPFGHVLVHKDPVAQRSAEELGALAYTTGSHIVLGENHVSDEVMFEELDHVRQQALGPVPGTDNGRGERVSHPNDPFERSAGSNGRKVARGDAPDLSLPGAAAPGGPVHPLDGDVPVQRRNCAASPCGRSS